MWMILYMDQQVISKMHMLVQASQAHQVSKEFIQLENTRVNDMWTMLSISKMHNNSMLKPTNHLKII